MSKKQKIYVVSMIHPERGRIYLTKNSRWTAAENLKGLWTEETANYLAKRFRAEVFKIVLRQGLGQ